MHSIQFLHERFNARSDQIPPVRIKKMRRTEIYPLFAELGYKVGAEVGVAGGHNAENICKAVPGVMLYLIDPWEKYGDNPRAHDNQREMWDLAHEKLGGFNVEFCKGFSMDLVKNFKRHELDFVYIDGHHSFDYVMMDLIEWSLRVRPGGMVAGHDYYRFRWAGVQNAVDSYTRAHQINEFFLTDEKESSFFWGKPDKDI